MQNEFVWQSVSLVIWLQMKMSSAIKFHARVSALYTHQSANDRSRIFFAVLVNMLAEICETLLLPWISVPGCFSTFKHVLILPKYLPAVNLLVISRIALGQRLKVFYCKGFLSYQYSETCNSKSCCFVIICK